MRHGRPPPPRSSAASEFSSCRGPRELSTFNGGRHLGARGNIARSQTISIGPPSASLPPRTTETARLYLAAGTGWSLANCARPRIRASRRARDCVRSLHVHPPAPLCTLRRARGGRWAAGIGAVLRSAGCARRAIMPRQDLESPVRFVCEKLAFSAAQVCGIVRL